MRHTAFAMHGPLITHGMVRRVSRSLSRCELFHLARQEIDSSLAASQHAAFSDALTAAGVQVTVLPEEPSLPDATFIEDTLIMLDELAVVCRLGALSREREADRIVPIAEQFRPLHRILPPGTLEGGDILRLGKELYAGLGSRTNHEGIRQLEQIVRPFGYTVRTVKVQGCLHLKTGVTSPDRGLVLLNPRWIDPATFRGLECLEVPQGEPWGGNTLSVNGRVLVAASAPRTADMLAGRGLEVVRVDISELQKAEAGLTCLSVLFSQPPPKTSGSPGQRAAMQ